MQVRRIDPQSNVVSTLKEIEGRIASQETTASGTIYISQQLVTSDPETGVTTLFGVLPDGSYGFQPFVNDITPPPVPSTLSATSSAGTIIVTWDGTFVGGELAPSDFQYCNVYGTRSGDLTPTLFGSVKNANDSVVAGADMVTAGDSWTFWATSLDYNKNESAAGVSTAPITIASVLDGSQYSDQIDANTAAIADAQGAIDTKNTVWRQDTTPVPASGYSNRVGDTWFDTSNGNMPKTWDGTTWVSVQDASISAASQTASAAQASANGKNTIKYSSSIASGTGTAVGDIWFQTNASNSIIGQWQWSGSAWIQQTVDNALITANLDAGKITAGFISAARLQATDIQTKFLSAGTVSASALITPGSITAASGVIGSLDAGSITSGTVATTRLDAAGIRAAIINVGKITANDMVAGTITAASGIIADINADKITSGTINATYVAIGSGSNALSDPGFNSTQITNARTALSSGGTAGWTIANGTSTSFRQATRTTTSANDNFNYIVDTNTYANAGQMIPVVAGQVWVFKVDTTTDISAGVRFNLHTVKADATVAFASASPYNTASGQRTITYTYTVPAGVTGIMIGLACNTTGVVWTVHGNAFVGMQTTGDLLVNGAIDGKTITGATIQTATSGARVVMDTSGLNIYDAFGSNYLSASNSGLTATGSFISNFATGDVVNGVSKLQTISIAPIKVNTGTFRTAGILFDTNTKSGQVAPTIYSSDGDFIMISSGVDSVGASRPSLALGDGGITMSTNSGVSINGDSIVPYGCKLSVPTNGMTIPFGNSPSSGIIIPYAVRSSAQHDYNDGYVVTAGAITVPKKGIYSITAGVGNGGALSGYGLKMYVEVNGVWFGATETPMPNGTTWVNCVFSASVRLNAGDVVRARCFLTGGGTGTLPNSGETTFITLKV